MEVVESVDGRPWSVVRDSLIKVELFETIKELEVRLLSSLLLSVDKVYQNLPTCVQILSPYPKADSLRLSFRGQMLTFATYYTPVLTDRADQNSP